MQRTESTEKEMGFDPKRYTPGVLAFLIHGLSEPLLTSREKLVLPIVAYPQYLSQFAPGQRLQIRSELSRWLMGESALLPWVARWELLDALQSSIDSFAAIIGEGGNYSWKMDTFRQLYCNLFPQVRPGPLISSEIRRMGDQVLRNINETGHWARFCDAMPSCPPDHELKHISDALLAQSNVFFCAWRPIRILLHKEHAGKSSVRALLRLEYEQALFEVPWKVSEQPTLAKVQNALNADPRGWQLIRRYIHPNLMSSLFGDPIWWPDEDDSLNYQIPIKGGIATVNLLTFMDASVRAERYFDAIQRQAISPQNAFPEGIAFPRGLLPLRKVSGIKSKIEQWRYGLLEETEVRRLLGHLQKEDIDWPFLLLGIPLARLMLKKTDGNRPSLDRVIKIIVGHSGFRRPKDQLCSDYLRLMQLPHPSRVLLSTLSKKTIAGIIAQKYLIEEGVELSSYLAHPEMAELLPALFAYYYRDRIAAAVHWMDEHPDSTFHELLNSTGLPPRWLVAFVGLAYPEKEVLLQEACSYSDVDFHALAAGQLDDKSILAV